jgi:hypothetical protein
VIWAHSHCRMALSHCRIEHVAILLARRAHAAVATSRHVCTADARKARCVLADVRWRWTLKVLWGAARTRRHRGSRPAADLCLQPAVAHRRVNGGIRKIVRHAPDNARFSSNPNQPTAVFRFMALLLRPLDHDPRK